MEQHTGEYARARAPMIMDPVDSSNNPSNPAAGERKKAVVALVHGLELQPNDIVFGPRSDENETYLKILNGWWKIYERSGHIDKRNIADAAIQELLSAGVRFLVPCKNNPTSEVYTLLPNDSRKIKDKVMRQLRKLIRDNTAHLTEEQVDERKAIIKAQRRAKTRGVTMNKPPACGIDTWDGIWESGDKAGGGDSAPIPEPFLVQPYEMPHGAAACSSARPKLSQWSGSEAFQGHSSLVEPAAVAGAENWTFQQAAACKSRENTKAFLSLGDLQEFVARPRADSENLDLSDVFEDSPDDELGGSNAGCSCDTLVCPQGGSRGLERIRAAAPSIDRDPHQFLPPQNRGMLELLVDGHASSRHHRESDRGHQERSFIAVVDGSIRLGLEQAMEVAYCDEQDEGPSCETNGEIDQDFATN